RGRPASRLRGPRRPVLSRTPPSARGMRLTPSDLARGAGLEEARPCSPPAFGLAAQTRSLAPDRLRPARFYNEAAPTRDTVAPGDILRPPRVPWGRRRELLDDALPLRGQTGCSRSSGGAPGETQVHAWGGIYVYAEPGRRRVV